MKNLLDLLKKFKCNFVFGFFQICSETSEDQPLQDPAKTKPKSYDILQILENEDLGHQHAPRQNKTNNKEACFSLMLI